MTTSNVTLPVVALVETRCAELGISRAELVRRVGYKNVSKGLRRLDQLFEGNVKPWWQLVEQLAAALSLPAAAIAQALSESEAQINQANESERRASFRPHGIILTERPRPNSMIMAGLAGADRRLQIKFDPGSAAITYARQAKVETLRRGHEFLIKHFYGAPTGFVVNYSPDQAVQFQLDGSPVAKLDTAFEPGQLLISISARPLTPELMDLLMGGEPPKS